MNYPSLADRFKLDYFLAHIFILFNYRAYFLLLLISYPSFSQNTTNKLIVVDEENMHCFEVKGNCPGVERQWKELEEYMYRKHTTRYAKRYWNSTMTSNGRHSPRTTATPNVTTEFYYDYSEVDESKHFSHLISQFTDFQPFISSGAVMLAFFRFTNSTLCALCFTGLRVGSYYGCY